MSSVVLKGHYDGERIVLDERSGWAIFSMQALSRAYSDNEPEYTLADLYAVNKPMIREIASDCVSPN